MLRVHVFMLSVHSFYFCNILRRARPALPVSWKTVSSTNNDVQRVCSLKAEADQSLLSEPLAEWSWGTLSEFNPSVFIVWLQRSRLWGKEHISPFPF